VTAPVTAWVTGNAAGNTEPGPWVPGLRAYITVTGEPYPRVTDHDGWPSLARWLQGGAFSEVADHVVSITVISRHPDWPGCWDYSGDLAAEVE
jgi:hypothetical protein